MAVQLSQYHLLRRFFFFSIVYSYLLCQRLIDHMFVCVSFLGVYSIPLICTCAFVPIPHCFAYCSFVTLPKVRVMPPVLFCFPQYCFGNSGSFMLPLNFRMICSNSVKNVIGNLIVHVHACSVAKLCPTLFNIMDCRPQDPFSMRFSMQEC